MIAASILLLVGLGGSDGVGPEDGPCSCEGSRVLVCLMAFGSARLEVDGAGATEVYGFMSASGANIKELRA